MLTLLPNELLLYHTLLLSGEKGPHHLSSSSSSSDLHLSFQTDTHGTGEKIDALSRRVRRKLGNSSPFFSQTN